MTGTWCHSTHHPVEGKKILPAWGDDRARKGRVCVVTVTQHVERMAGGQTSPTLLNERTSRAGLAVSPSPEVPPPPNRVRWYLPREGVDRLPAQSRRVALVWIDEVELCLEGPPARVDEGEEDAGGHRGVGKDERVSKGSRGEVGGSRRWEELRLADVWHCARTTLNRPATKRAAKLASSSSVGDASDARSLRLGDVTPGNGVRPRSTGPPTSSLLGIFPAFRNLALP
ncbi:hypothetical protein OF83DRAFT_1088633 [Amylostereum chailletii]|nr:hypothetical protein OF83DRAFT_1088633 [Amylostereum chailletii]